MVSKGISAIIATILLLVITIAMAGLAYVYVSGIFTRTTTSVSLVDSYCVNGDIHIFIQNQGQTSLSKDSVRIVNIDANCTTDPTLTEDLSPGVTVEIVATGCERGRQHTYRIISPAGGVPVSVYCT